MGISDLVALRCVQKLEHDDAFKRRFRERMLDLVGPVFSDGSSVAEYAEQTAVKIMTDPTYANISPEEWADGEVDCFEPDLERGGDDA